MSNLQHVPDILTKGQLLKILENISEGITIDDTLEGFIEFTVNDADTWKVTARYRVGNREGQGFVRMIGSFEPS